MVQLIDFVVLCSQSFCYGLPVDRKWHLMLFCVRTKSYLLLRFNFTVFLSIESFSFLFQLSFLCTKLS